MTDAAQAKIAVKTTAYSEFVKALDIIDQTQLTLFIEEKPLNKEQQLKTYEARMLEAEADISQNAPDFAKQLEEKRVEIMRSIISKTIQQYNDKYANYITPESLKKYSSRRNGNVDGIGLKFRAVPENYPIAIGPLQGGPLDGKDIEPGDKLLRIDETDFHALSSSEIEAALKGPSGSAALLTLSRDDVEHSIQVQRAAVKLHYVDAELIHNDIGYIKISRFGSDTHVQVGKLLAEILLKGAKSFVLDMRDNPGGSTLAARAIVSMFCTENEVYFEKFKNGAVRKLPRIGEHRTSVPLAVLMNEDSMSSSEIVAGAVQSYSRGIVVGTTSYGKGLIQKVFNLEAPLGGAIRTTIAEFGRPDGKMIHAVGVVPDEQIKTNSDFMFKRIGSLNVSEKTKAFQRTLLERAIRKKHPKHAEELIAAKDAQLDTAIKALKKLAFAG